jgi:TRAP-type C4-dicarboxylate transport system substrate-binding protein
VHSGTSVPAAARLNQSFGIAKYMNDVRWAPLIGATLISRRAWESLPQSERAERSQAARESGEGMGGGVRKMGDDAIATMRKRGLTVTETDEPGLSIEMKWRGLSAPSSS